MRIEKCENTSLTSETLHGGWVLLDLGSAFGIVAKERKLMDLVALSESWRRTYVKGGCTVIGETGNGKNLKKDSGRA